MRAISLTTLLFATFLIAQASSDNDRGHDSHEDQHDHNSHTKLVKGKAFDRIITIWLENTDFDDAVADPSMRALAKKGISLTNYFALTHPSEPNYAATVGGDYLGMDSDDLFNFPRNFSSVVDLLEDKGISWAEYQEDMPFTGFQGFSFPNPRTGADDYVRKHDPLILFESVTSNPKRLANIRNFTLFERDLAARALPQWIFITPNMTNDAHDTNITFGGRWSLGFVERLLENRQLKEEKTLIVLTFDENENKSQPNRVFTILLGSAIPQRMVGKTDDYFYSHYSAISTVEANWNLHTLGRWDVGANVFDFVAQKTGDTMRKSQNIDAIVLNGSYPGIFNSKKFAKQAIPNTRLVQHGRTVLPAIQKQWASQVRCTGYLGQLVPPGLVSPPPIPSGC